MLASSIRVPVARSWSGVRPLTVAWVPTGMNAGRLERAAPRLEQAEPRPGARVHEPGS